MKKWRENIFVKALAFTAAVAAFAAAAIMGWYQLANFDALWGEYSTAEGYTVRYLMQEDGYYVRQLLDYYRVEEQGGSLSAYQRRAKAQLEESLSADSTNLRWQLIGADGTVLRGNTSDSGGSRGTEYWYTYDWESPGPATEIGPMYWPDVAQGAVNIAWSEASWVGSEGWIGELIDLVTGAQGGGSQDNAAQSQPYPSPDAGEVSPDTVLTDPSGETEVLVVTTDQGRYVYGPSVENALTVNQFGYRFDVDTLSWKRVAGAETGAANLVLWVDGALRVDDQYRMASAKLEQWEAARGQWLAITIVCAVAGLLLTVYLCAGAGHRRGIEGVSLNWFHRIPGDILLAIMAAGAALALLVGLYIVWDSYGHRPMYFQLIFLGAATAVLAALGLGALVTVTARCKAHTLLRNTLIWRLCRWGWRQLRLCAGAARQATGAVPLIWKAVVCCLVYIAFTVTGFNDALPLWLIVTVAAMVYLCLWAYQWKKIRWGTQEIIGGNPDYHIDTRRMFPDLRGHADELNNLGQSISAAVEERMRSEHFKAELITNVSHDLKTPLTSIINYVDLLKKADIQDPQALEYIEVLDRKSQRLKKLTEDLVEASKASTGSLTVSWERLDLTQLIDQALAECGDRLAGQGLAVVRTLPEGPVWVNADGRHLWRVLDNLLTNCAKYAMRGTRVYLELRCADGWAALSVKNISRDELNVPAEVLMERFARGDTSRTAEGSGLGLSIAQSLTELQHGRFRIDVDGDLFKALVELPLVEGPERD